MIKSLANSELGIHRGGIGTESAGMSSDPLATGIQRVPVRAIKYRIRQPSREQPVPASVDGGCHLVPGAEASWCQGMPVRA